MSPCVWFWCLLCAFLPSPLSRSSFSFKSWPICANQCSVVAISVCVFAEWFEFLFFYFCVSINTINGNNEWIFRMRKMRQNEINTIFRKSCFHEEISEKSIKITFDSLSFHCHLVIIFFLTKRKKKYLHLRALSCFCIKLSVEATETIKHKEKIKLINFIQWQKWCSYIDHSSERQY